MGYCRRVRYDQTRYAQSVNPSNVVPQDSSECTFPIDISQDIKISTGGVSQRLDTYVSPTSTVLTKGGPQSDHHSRLRQTTSKHSSACQATSLSVCQYIDETSLLCTATETVYNTGTSRPFRGATASTGGPQTTDALSSSSMAVIAYATFDCDCCAPCCDSTSAWSRSTVGHSAETTYATDIPRDHDQPTAHNRPKPGPSSASAYASVTGQTCSTSVSSTESKGGGPETGACPAKSRRPETGPEARTGAAKGWRPKTGIAQSKGSLAAIRARTASWSRRTSRARQGS